MAATFQLEIATPERLLLKEDVSEAQIPAAQGYLGVLPEHAPLLSELGTGDLTFKVGSREGHLAVNGGWVEVLPEHVRVLANSAEHASEIDVARAESALKRAEDRLSHCAADLTIDPGRALNALKRAQARLKAASGK
jgi:F-type H+-transporting ATPase subunit epsilon